MRIDCGECFGFDKEERAGEVPVALGLVPVLICLAVLYFVGMFG